MVDSSPAAIWSERVIGLQFNIFQFKQMSKYIFSSTFSFNTLWAREAQYEETLRISFYNILYYILFYWTKSIGCSICFLKILDLKNTLIIFSPQECQCQSHHWPSPCSRSIFGWDSEAPKSLVFFYIWNLSESLVLSS